MSYQTMTYDYRKFEEESLKKIAETKGVVLDVGGGSRFMKGMKRFEGLFADCRYRTLDVSPDYGPDIVGDIHAIPLEQSSVDGVVCRSVLEHVERPLDAVREIHRILKPGGYFYLHVPSVYPYHARTGAGAYPDYWRFFEDSLRLVMKDFASVEIRKRGGWFMAMSMFLPGQARMRKTLDVICLALDRMLIKECKKTTPMYYCLARK